MDILQLLFPKRCIQCKKIGAYVCPQCFSYITFQEHMVCAVCQRQTINGHTHPACKTRCEIDGVFSSLVYQGIVKKLIHNFKYPPYLTDEKSFLIELFYEGLIQKEAFYDALFTPSIFVPIPLHRKRFRQRGYNQSFLLASELAKKWNIHVSDCLVRVKETKTQVGLSKEERKFNIQDAFIIAPPFHTAIALVKQIFLVDDVATSGATLREAAKILKKAGVQKVWGITLAHGE